jgi:hypothetical protein
MKWFDKWFAKKCKQALNDSQNEPVEESKYANSIGLTRPNSKRNALIRSDVDLHSRGVNFTLYNANGGTVIELRDYDPMNDRHHNTLYVIPKEADLGQQLGHIVTMEALKR